MPQHLPPLPSLPHSLCRRLRHGLFGPLAHRARRLAAAVHVAVLRTRVQQLEGTALHIALYDRTPDSTAALLRMANVALTGPRDHAS